MRERLATALHNLALRIHDDSHYLVIRDADGVEFLSITCGGYCAVGPPEPYTLHCCEDGYA